MPGTAPIALTGARTRLSTPRSRPPAFHRRGRSRSIVPLATAPMLRRWDARGNSRGGPEGRRSGTPRFADCFPPPGTPHCLSDTRLHPATRLMGRRDARPHNTDRNAGAPGHHHEVRHSAGGAALTLRCDAFVPFAMDALRVLCDAALRWCDVCDEIRGHPRNPRPICDGAMGRQRQRPPLP